MTVTAAAIAAEHHNEYQALLQTKGFPETKTEVSGMIRQYWSVQEILHEYESVATMDLRIIIPRNLSRQTLENLHAAHQDLTGMRARSKLSVWWPGFNKDLERFLASCMHCRYMGKSQSREPLSPTPCPTYPFESVVADHFDYGGHQYTAIANRFSGWLEVFGDGCGAGNPVQACKDLFT